MLLFSAEKQLSIFFEFFNRIDHKRTPGNQTSFTLVGALPYLFRMVVEMVDQRA
jgi:hypothetical protein